MEKSKDIKTTEIKEEPEVKEVKKAKKVENLENTTESEFKELSEFTQKEIEKLGKVPVIIRKVYYKKSNRIGYEIEVRLHKYLTIKKNFRFESQYNLILLELGLDDQLAQHTLVVPCRFVKGINKNGNPYHQIELVFGKDLFYGDLWLNGSDLLLFNKVLPNVKFDERNSTLDMDTENLYYQE